MMPPTSSRAQASWTFEVSLREHAGLQAVARVVDQVERLGEVLVGVEHRDRAEDLVGHDRARRAAPPRAAPGGRPSPHAGRRRAGGRPAATPSAIHCSTRSALAASISGPHTTDLIGRVAGGERCGRHLERPPQADVDLLVGEDPLHRDARLAGVADRPPPAIRRAIASRSPASGSTITAALPPSSSVTRRRQPSSLSRQPTAIEPVKVSMAMRSSTARRSASAPELGMTDRAPLGRPASRGWRRAAAPGPASGWPA